MESSVRVGVLGVGGWGKNHLRVLSELGGLTCFCDVDQEKIKTYEEKYSVKGYASLDEMTKNERLDAVSICTPATTHYQLAERCVKAGLDTFVEKPFTLSSMDGEKLVELAKEKQVLLAAGYIERFNPAVQELKQVLRSGKIGEPLLLEFHRENRWAGTVRDTGIVADTSVHDIDTARWIFESEPRTVFARTGRVISQYEDFATIILGFDKQRTAFIVSNWVTPKRVRQLITVCTGAIATVDFITQELRIDDAQGTTVPRRPWEEPLVQELKSFIQCVNTRKQPLVSGEDAVKTTRIAEAALASAKSGAPIYLQL